MRKQFSNRQQSNQGQRSPFSKYDIKEMIGQGQFGKVYKAYLKSCHNGIQQCYAIKVIPVGKIKKNPKLKQLLKNEVEILCTLDHPNIIKFYELFCWEHKIYMVYEYCEGGDLEDALPLSQNQAENVFAQIANACSFAQENFILHRDLKPANILFKKGVVKVADWGFSRFLQENLSTKSFVGSPAYMAPQILTGAKYTNKTDLWSYGIMMYESIIGKLPWSASNIQQLLKLINRSKAKIPENLGSLTKKILKYCLKVDPDKRFSFSKIKSLFDKNCQKLYRTESKLNPEIQEQKDQLSENQIKMCTYFLQFTKQSQKFSSQKLRSKCLDFTVLKLKQMRSLMISSLPGNRYTQRSLNSSSKKTSKKFLSSQSTSLKQQQETFMLLDRQIDLIQKIKYQNGYCQQQEKYVSERTIKKQIIGHMMKALKICGSDEYLRQSIKILVQFNCFLNLLIYEDMLPARQEQSFINHYEQFKQANCQLLLKLLNFKIIHIKKSI